jgi:hypothetical protein
VPDVNDIGVEYIYKTLIANLMNGKVTLPTADRKGREEVTLSEMGISYPVLWKPENPEDETIDNPAAAPVNPGDQGVTRENKITVKKQKFTVMFCWQPKLPHERLAEKEKKKAESAPDADATNLAP